MFAEGDGFEKYEKDLADCQALVDEYAALERILKFMTGQETSFAEDKMKTTTKCQELRTKCDTSADTYGFCPYIQQDSTIQDLKDLTLILNDYLAYFKQYTEVLILADLDQKLIDAEEFLNTAEKKAFLAWVDSISFVGALGPCAPLKSFTLPFRYKNSRGSIIYDRDFIVYYIGGAQCTAESYKYSFTASEDFWNNALIYGVSDELGELVDNSETLTKFVESLEGGTKQVFNIVQPGNNVTDRVAFRVNRDSL